MLKFIIITLKDDPKYKKVLTEKLYLQSKYLIDLIGDSQEEEESITCTFEISPGVMDLIILFMDYHSEIPMNVYEKPIKTNIIEDIIGKWDANFINSLSDELLVELILSANYLNCEKLVDLGMLRIACAIKDCEFDDVLKKFEGESISEEDMQKIAKENSWVFNIGILE